MTKKGKRKPGSEWSFDKKTFIKHFDSLDAALNTCMDLSYKIKKNRETADYTFSDETLNQHIK